MLKTNSNNMKKQLFLLFFVTIAILTNAQTSNIIVKGSIKFPDDKNKVLITYSDKFEKIIVDSIEVRSDSTFEKTIALPFPGIYNLDCQRWESLSFWGEDENIEVHFRGVDTARVKIKNPPYQFIENPGRNNELMNLINYFDYMSYQGMIAAGKEVYMSSQSSSDEWKEYTKGAYDRNFQRSSEYINFLARYYGDRNSAIALISRVRDEELKNNLISYFENSKPNYSPYVKYKKELELRIAQNAKLAKGSIAPDFSYATPDGKGELGPKDFKGKYLLIDFWASWCGPCLKSIPELKEIYSKYSDKDFEILSVSIDGKDADWKKALKEQNMPWKQVGAPNSGKDVMDMYQFRGIPHLVLLDKDGKIISRNVSMDSLEEFLGEVMVQ